MGRANGKLPAFAVGASGVLAQECFEDGRLCFLRIFDRAAKVKCAGKKLASHIPLAAAKVNSSRIEGARFCGVVEPAGSESIRAP